MLVVLDVREQQGGPVAIAKGTPRDGAKFAVPVYFGANLMKLAFPPQMRDPPTQITKLHVFSPDPCERIAQPKHYPDLHSVGNVRPKHNPKFRRFVTLRKGEVDGERNRSRR